MECSSVFQRIWKRIFGTVEKNWFFMDLVNEFLSGSCWFSKDLEEIFWTVVNGSSGNRDKDCGLLRFGFGFWSSSVWIWILVFFGLDLDLVFFGLDFSVWSSSVWIWILVFFVGFGFGLLRFGFSVWFFKGIGSLTSFRVVTGFQRIRIGFVGIGLVLLVWSFKGSGSVSSNLDRIGFFGLVFQRIRIKVVGLVCWSKWFSF